MKKNNPYSVATPRTKRSCFSLVEMLVVMAIIGILAGVGVGAYTVARRKLAQSATQAMLSKIRISLESYKSKYGYYPHQNGIEINFYLDIIPANYSANDPGNPKNNLNQFMDYKKLQDEDAVKISGIFYLKDAFSGANKPAVIPEIGVIKYRSPGTVNTSSFDLYSAGPDRNFSTTRDNIYAK